MESRALEPGSVDPDVPPQHARRYAVGLQETDDELRLENGTVPSQLGPARLLPHRSTNYRAFARDARTLDPKPLRLAAGSGDSRKLPHWQVRWLVRRLELLALKAISGTRRSSTSPAP